MDLTPAHSKNSAIADAISHFGSMSEMARSLRVSGHQVIQDWVRRGVVPAEHCPEIEKRTGVRCEKLNPKIDWAYLRSTSPDLAEVPSRAGASDATDDVQPPAGVPDRKEGD